MKADNLDFEGTLRQRDASGHQSRGPEHWQAGSTRLRVSSGPSDGDNRGIAGVIEVER